MPLGHKRHGSRRFGEESHVTMHARSDLTVQCSVRVLGAISMTFYQHRACPRRALVPWNVLATGTHKAQSRLRRLQRGK